MRKILTLNGGGALGLIPAVILMNLEEELGKPCYEIFDMIAGISTGSILGACLAKGMPAKEVVKTYADLIPKVFGSPRPLWRQIFSSKYDSAALEAILKEHLDIPFNSLKTKFMAHAVQISGTGIQPKFWKSWYAETNPAYKIVKASCSAPTYFDPTVIDDTYYIDGGIATNNASMCALAEHIRLGGTLSDVYIVNLACYTASANKNPSKLHGLLDWAKALPGTFLAVSDPLAEYQCHQLIGFRNHAIDPVFNAPLDFQDIDAMMMVANKTWSEHSKSLILNIKD